MMAFSKRIRLGGAAALAIAAGVTVISVPAEARFGGRGFGGFHGGFGRGGFGYGGYGYGGFGAYPYYYGIPYGPYAYGPYAYPYVPYAYGPAPSVGYGPGYHPPGCYVVNRPIFSRYKRNHVIGYRRVRVCR